MLEGGAVSTYITPRQRRNQLAKTAKRLEKLTAL